MKNRRYIIFEVSKELKSKITETASNYKSNGVRCPLKSSAFCRMAIEDFIKEIGNKK